MNKAIIISIVVLVILVVIVILYLVLRTPSTTESFTLSKKGRNIIGYELLYNKIYDKLQRLYPDYSNQISPYAYWITNAIIRDYKLGNHKRIYDYEINKFFRNHPEAWVKYLSNHY